MKDEQVNHPDHYLGTRKYEPVDVINDWKLGFNLGNALKYISRANRKDNTIVDLEKAIWYIRYEIDSIKKDKEQQNKTKVTVRVKKAHIINKDKIIKKRELNNDRT